MIARPSRELIETEGRVRIGHPSAGDLHQRIEGRVQIAWMWKWTKEHMGVHHLHERLERCDGFSKVLDQQRACLHTGLILLSRNDAEPHTKPGATTG